MLPIPREEKKQQIKMLMMNLLIFVLVPVFIFALVEYLGPPFLRHGHRGPPFFSIFKTWAYGATFFQFLRLGVWATFFQFLKHGRMGHLFSIFKTWAYRATFFQFLRHGRMGPPFFSF